ncbi:nucleoside triphosphate pyrophosphohydrolase [Mesobacillus subterraneus]|uniref:nucleoside triphosphate pyrophosphohydrolase n=1 Tax=Mesobacillus subterraneus TaxID=285983 RepID=UPI00203FD02B|nr:nucleoside triphosphate pyrophosphohydrolase [Mesobacillus subterraneus]MCM3665838.1 nucleoside triphosphate pyrophosphohydrolase [Mesobacillus subterraneus]MCM3684771.1 nucleoside triphosphate pyrophosphohydrolase [Mesobacillus subterraneus]
MGKTKIYNKLVRDRIPEIISRSGKTFNTRQLTSEEYIRELKNKALEELNEFINSNNKHDAGEELADLLEVMHSLAEYNGFDFTEIEEIRQHKEKSRGGFKNRIYLIEVEY